MRLDTSEMEADISRLRAALAEARDIMRPFAALATAIECTTDHEYYDHEEWDVKIGDLRRARAFLERTVPPPPQEATARSEKMSVQKERQRAQQARNCRTAELMKLEAENTSLRAAAAEARATHEEFRADVAGLEDKIEGLQTALAEAERERDELRIKHIRGNYAELGDGRELEAWQKLWDRAERAEAELAAAREVIEFYADPESYFAIGFLPDKPCGEFIEDFSDDHGSESCPGYRPGKRARAFLDRYRREGLT